LINWRINQTPTKNYSLHALLEHLISWHINLSNTPHAVPFMVLEKHKVIFPLQLLSFFNLICVIQHWKLLSIYNVFSLYWSRPISGLYTSLNKIHKLNFWTYSRPGMTIRTKSNNILICMIESKQKKNLD